MPGPITRDPRRVGFTLIELLIVMAIIGILISLILVASADGVRRAEFRQTQTLITKLETALTDRVDALLASPPPINQVHRLLAAITRPDPVNAGNFLPIDTSIDRRAQAIAQFDFMKAELPDVFYVNSDTNHPLNFASTPFPLNNPNGRDDFALPLGNRSPGLPYVTIAPNIPTLGFNPSTGLNDFGNPGSTSLVIAADTGIYGASFTAAASLYKNLYEAAALDLLQLSGATANAKLGYDTTDNDGDGYVDNIGEVTVNGGTNAQFRQAVATRLGKHDHKTARSEMLYALLVEGQGPLGSVYNREDFTNRDVADTDGDGMLEFIDAWGEPLQFYRWPIYYGSLGGGGGSTTGSSDSQMGFQPYSAARNTPRQLDPLDPNQLLVSVSWWSQPSTTVAPVVQLNQALATMFTNAATPNFSTGYTGSPASPQANAFMTYFHILIDPQGASPPSGLNPSPNWDRTGSTRRRAYYSKFLVLSAGPDKEPGVFQLNKDYTALPDTGTGSSPVAFPTGNTITDSHLVNWCESQAAQVEFTGRTGPFFEQVNSAQASVTSLYLQNNAGLDDITNQNFNGPGTGAK